MKLLHILCILPLLLYEADGGSVHYTTNIAKNKRTRQSSTSYDGLSSRAVDGNRNSIYTNKSCTHTNHDRHAWWGVDLEDSYAVAKVKLTNRGDCCGNRLRNFDIRVGNVDGKPLANKLCYHYASAVTEGKTVEIICDKPVRGRYVFVMLRGKNALTLCEVEVYAIKGSGGSVHYTTNIAKNKRTRQSSTSYDGLSSRAVDGNRNSIYTNKSCTHTNHDRHAWWGVDLEDSYAVAKVKLTNRGDCCGNRLRNFDIRVGNVDGKPLANKLCYHYASAVTQGKTVEIICDKPVRGRYVFVMLRGKNALTLCEVEVYAIKGSGGSVHYTTNIAKNKITRQSSTSYGGLSSRAVDGNRNSIYSGKSCTHTNHDRHAWWGVDLEDSYAVAKVKLTNRGDCCGNRLRNFDIRVRNGDGKPLADKLCYHYASAVTQGKTVEIICDKPVRGRYVFVMLRGKNSLTLCEVEVYAIEGSEVV